MFWIPVITCSIVALWNISMFAKIKIVLYNNSTVLSLIFDWALLRMKNWIPYFIVVHHFNFDHVMFMITKCFLNRMAIRIFLRVRLRGSSTASMTKKYITVYRIIIKEFRFDKCFRSTIFTLSRRPNKLRRKIQKHHKLCRCWYF
jgi:hypothetical protein